MRNQQSERPWVIDPNEIHADLDPNPESTAVLREAEEALRNLGNPAPALCEAWREGGKGALTAKYNELRPATTQLNDEIPTLSQTPTNK